LETPLSFRMIWCISVNFFSSNKAS
jgi:hypothetical protein